MVNTNVAPYSPEAAFSTIQKKIENKEPIFVRNMTGGAGKPMMALTVTYPSSGGQERAHNVPATSIPYDISGHIPHDKLNESYSFRHFINLGHLEVVPEEVAIHELRDPSVRKTWHRAHMEANNTSIARKDEMLKERYAREEERKTSDSMGKAIDDFVAAQNPAVAKRLGAINSNAVPERSSMEGGRNMRFVSIEKRVKQGALDGDNLIDELTAILGQLSDRDLKSIIASPLWPEHSQEWARERLAFRQEGAPPKKQVAGESFDPDNHA